MSDVRQFFVYLAVMSGITYAVRLLPLLLCKQKIRNVFIQSFLYYVPYAVLGAMTFPAVFYSAGSTAAAVAGCITAVVLAWFEKSLLVVAASASAVVLATEIILGVIAK